jgi:hypothetical protein
LRSARPNPVTGGFVILVDSSGILRLNPDFSVARNVFELACVDDYLEAFSSALLYNSSRKEFICFVDSILSELYQHFSARNARQSCSS